MDSAARNALQSISCRVWQTDKCLTEGLGL